jgi:hypothetical protein
MRSRHHWPLRRVAEVRPRQLLNQKRRDGKQKGVKGHLLHIYQTLTGRHLQRR